MRSQDILVTELVFQTNLFILVRGVKLSVELDASHILALFEN
jgi:hypothetical protein